MHAWSLVGCVLSLVQYTTIGIRKYSFGEISEDFAFVVACGTSEIDLLPYLIESVPISETVTTVRFGRISSKEATRAKIIIVGSMTILFVSTTTEFRVDLLDCN